MHYGHVLLAVGIILLSICIGCSTGAVGGVFTFGVCIAFWGLVVTIDKWISS